MDRERASARLRGAGHGRLADALRAEFELIGELGRGGMGVVYKARDVGSGREVALKLILGEGSKKRQARFAREGKIVAGLDHPGIVKVHRAGETAGHPWLAYELVQGARTLDEVLASADLDEKLEWVRDAARAVGHAHERGIVHRDLKPGNLLVDDHGQLRVVDFGLGLDGGEAERLTKTGALLGTPAYMAPEQITGQRVAVAPPTDVWALGAILYQAVVGREPFEAESFVQLSRRIVDGDYVPLSKAAPEVDRRLEPILAKALTTDPSQRYPDGDALADALDLFLVGGGEVRRPPVVVLAGLGAGLLLLGVGAAYALSASPPPAEVSAPTPEAPAARLAIEGALPETVWGDSVEVALLTSPADLKVVGQGGDGWSRRSRAKAGRLALRLPLSSGENRFRFEAEGAPPLELTIRSRDVPGWYRRLSEAKRPGLPLPAGLTFGQASGEYVNDVDGSVLVYVPPGAFVMGDNTLLEGQEARTVTVEQGYFMGKFEVTWEQYRRFCKARGKVPPPNILVGRTTQYEDVMPSVKSKEAPGSFIAAEDHPAFGIGYHDAVDYCAWAGLRLPTEVEWEYAARGTDGRLFPWGNDGQLLYYNSESLSDGFPYTAPVGSYPKGKSPFGCLDMAGNVWEWTSDVHTGWQRKALAGDDFRVMRGGGWNCIPVICQTNYRDGRNANTYFRMIGLRVCRSAE